MKYVKDFQGFLNESKSDIDKIIDELSLWMQDHKHVDDKVCTQINKELSYFVDMDTKMNYDKISCKFNKEENSLDIYYDGKVIIVYDIKAKQAFSTGH